jgi:hypothetical protein
MNTLTLTPEQTRALKALSAMIKPHATIYGIRKKRSGERDYFELYVIGRDVSDTLMDDMVRITGLVATLCRLKYSDKHTSIYMGGGNYDKGHEAVEQLAGKLNIPIKQLKFRWL